MTTIPILFMVLSLASAPPAPSPYFTLHVVDEATGRGVPLVELKTTSAISLWTDSAGVAVFHEPGLMNRRVWFAVSSPGYEFAKDGFGFRGRALQTTPGTTATLKIKRINLAERLYRVTGGGIYRDSVLAGREVPLREPLLNGQVLGSDSVVNAVYRGKYFWVWGDTNRPSYPLGNFHVTGATSLLPGKGGLPPGVGIDLNYFVDDTGFARGLAAMPGEGPTWITSLVVLPDGDKRDRLIASYIKVKPPMTVYARGLAIFNDDKGVFERLGDFDFSAPCHPSGHAFLHREDGREYVYFAHPFPLTRVPATLEDIRRPERYESYTCLKEGSRLDRPEIDRDAAGRARYAWRKNTPPVGPMEQGKLVAQGKLKKTEALLQLRDRDSGKPVVAHAGSVYWNAYRRRWVMILCEWGGGPSFLGEAWYAEAPTPTGPWVYAVKVATHPRYSFYNPKHHPAFDEEGGRLIYFEGTYSHTFSGNHEQTPRYDYNQLMYRLDLGDARLALPAPVGKESYFALDRPVKGTVPVFAAEGGKLRVGEALTGDRAVPGARFYALPADAKDAPAATKVLHQDGKPLCRVWRGPAEE